MGVELEMLTYSAILAFVLVLIPATMKVFQYGLVAGVGNRDTPMPLDGWAGRAQRTASNMLESLPIFTALVLAVLLANTSNATTAAGAQLFFWARLVYAVIYYAGIPWLRTLVWLVAVAGMGMIASALF